MDDVSLCRLSSEGVIGRLAAQVRRRGLVRNALVLLSGTGLAQLVPILALPLLTRLYAPADFGLAGVYSAVLAVASVAASWRYEHAILLAASDEESASAFRLALRLTMATSVGVAIAAAAAESLIEQVVDPDYALLLALTLPLGIVLVGVTQACTVWLLRAERTGLISRGRVAGAIATVAVGLAGGWAGAGGAVLVAAAIAGQLTTAAVFYATTRGGLRVPTTVPARVIASKYKRFPMFTVPADLSSAAAAQYPLLFVSATYGSGFAGAFTLSQRVLGLPLSVVGSAVLDAYKREASALYASRGECYGLAVKSVVLLTVLALPAWLLVTLAAPSLFVWLFGQSWEHAGVISQVLATPLFLRFVMTPVSYNFYLAGRQAEDLAVQGYNLASAVLLLWAAAQWQVPATVAIAVYASNLTLVFAYYLVRSLMLSRRRSASGP